MSPKSPDFQKSTTEKENKNHRIVRLSSVKAIVGSCRARTATYSLRRQLLGASNYSRSWMRALRYTNSDPSTPFIWSWAGLESLPSIPTAPICHKSIISSVLVGQGVQGPPHTTCRLKTLVLFTSYQKPILDNNPSIRVRQRQCLLSVSVSTAA